MALTPQTLVERREIKDDLQAVRETGVGHDLEEVALGCCCVAAPVRDPRGAVVGSVGISVPADRWHREGARLTRLCVPPPPRRTAPHGPSPSRPEIGQECLSAHPEPA